MTETNTFHEGWVVVEGSPPSLAQEIAVRSHHLRADEPNSSGGTDTGPNSYALLPMAAGSCTSNALGLDAQRKVCHLGGVAVRRHSKVHPDE